MNFHQYIGTCRALDNPVGDFVKDARRDPTLPNATTWPELKAYLDGKGTSYNVIVAARDCFLNFRKYNKRPRVGG